MPFHRSQTFRPIRSLSAGLLVALATSCVAPPAATPPTTVPTVAVTTTTVPVPTFPTQKIMAASQLSADELVAWYEAKGIVGSRPAVSVETLADLYIDEGADEGVAGDLAFIQAMVETGWLRHSERVPPEYFNYAGIGAVDSGTGANQFRSARAGVRAQVQHLRAYSDKTTTCTNFAHATETPRCQYVSPKGKATTWNVMGGGNWASDPAYGAKILGLYHQALDFTASA